MDFNYNRPRTRLIEEYRSVSGAEVGLQYSSYFELYREVFLDALEHEGIRSDEALEAALLAVADKETVGSFLSDPARQIKELAAFGLVLLDRFIRTDWGRADPDNAFFRHEQLFECCEYVRDREKRAGAARHAAAAAWGKNKEARAWVLKCWREQREQYDNNKSEFARHFAKRVRNEFEIEISERQLKESWLSDNQ